MDGFFFTESVNKCVNWNTVLEPEAAVAVNKDKCLH